MSRLDRRTFLKVSAAASAAFPLFTIAGTKASGRVLGANEALRVGVAGINGRGSDHIKELTGLPNVQVTYLIDPDSRLHASRSQTVKDRGGNAPTCVQDIRQALEDKNLDAITVATCNHWHSLITVWACQAGKDVYVEKPISHNVFEGRKCVEAARNYDRIVQHGTQQRSSEDRARQIAAIQSGKYGKLLVTKGYCCKPRWSIGFKPNQAPPSEFDFNMWLGPAPEQPFHANLHPYNWHWFWDFGNGDIGNQGVHEMDVARWSIRDATLPTRVWSLGARVFPNGPDQGQTPNMMLSVMEFGDTLLVFETRGLVAKSGTKAPPFKVENEFYTTEGVIRGSKFYPHGGGKAQPVEGGEAQVAPGGPFGSFVAAVRAHDKSRVNCDAEVAHYSAALCHLSNISFRLGKPTPFAEIPGHLGNDKVVNAAYDVIVNNLKLVDVPVDTTPCILGRTLEFDPKTERFPNDNDANALLSRRYRPPFVVPEQV